MKKSKNGSSVFYHDDHGRRVAEVFFRGDTLEIGGREFPRIPYGYEHFFREELIEGKPVCVLNLISEWNRAKGLNLDASAGRCYVCQAEVGQLHEPGCYIEECPVCRMRPLAARRGKHDIPCPCAFLPTLPLPLT